LYHASELVTPPEAQRVHTHVDPLLEASFRPGDLLSAFLSFTTPALRSARAFAPSPVVSSYTRSLPFAIIHCFVLFTANRAIQKRLPSLARLPFHPEPPPSPPADITFTVPRTPIPKTTARDRLCCCFWPHYMLPSALSSQPESPCPYLPRSSLECACPRSREKAY
jgi:hypothetical protein